MRPKKKSKFFTFIFSFCPGFAEMYMGFMRMGVTILATFMVTVILAMTSNTEIFTCLAFIVYAYGFFHARHLAHTDDAEFNVYEDRYVWDELLNGKIIKVSDKKIKKWLAWILIFVGASIIYEMVIDFIIPYIPDSEWDTIYPMIDSIPSAVVAVIVIVIGIKLIKGKKVELDIDTDDITTIIEDAADKIVETAEDVKFEEVKTIETVEEKADETADGGKED